MSQTRLETAYHLVLANVQAIQTQLATHFYDALIEQHAQYTEMEENDEKLAANNQALRELHLTSEEWRQVYQFLLLKGAQTDKLQPNHQFTPDSIGFILLFLIEVLTDKDELEVIEIGSGTGNLALTLLSHSQKSLKYLGIELDDLLIDLAASAAELTNLPLTLIQGDAVRPHFLQMSDVILSDLPVGYYPDDSIASRYEVASPHGHTYAHHLLMEQSLKYLKPDGLAIFLAPTDLLTSPQASLLKKWLSQKATIQAVITLPEHLFAGQQNGKSIVVLRQQTDQTAETFVYPLTNLKSREALAQFMAALTDWHQQETP